MGAYKWMTMTEAQVVLTRHCLYAIDLQDQSFPVARALLALESRLAEVERERDEAQEKASHLPGLTAELDTLRHHYDAAAPEHNPPALLDLYFDRQVQAEARLARIETAAGEAEQEARHSSTLPPCPTCDPGNESAEVWGEIAAALKSALALPGAEGREGEGNG